MPRVPAHVGSGKMGFGGNRDPRSAFGANATRLEGGLTELQKSFARELVMEIFSRLLQDQAPEPTNIKQYSDVFDLTQTLTFAEWQERVLSAPAGVIHPGHRVLSSMIQLEQVDLVLQAMLGFLWNSRRTISHAVDNLKGVAYMIIDSMRGEITTISGTDKEGTHWQMYTSAGTPDSVVLRRAKLKAKKVKRERDKLRAIQERELRDRASDTP